MKVQKAALAFLETALWSDGILTEKPPEPYTGDFHRDDYHADKFDDASHELAQKVVALFYLKADSLVAEMDPDQVGHELWLTMRGHGTGFLDRGLGERGDKLSEIAREMGKRNLALYWNADTGKYTVE